jgi:methyl-accepting chemotaxis protein
MQSEITINAEQLGKTAQHMRTTLFEMSKTVERFDNAAAGLMQYAESFLDRLEQITARMEKMTETTHDARSLEKI